MATTGTPSRRSAPASPGNGSGRRRPPPRRRKKRNPVWQAIVTFVQAVTVLALVGFITLLLALGWQLRNAPSSIDLTFDPPGRTLIFSSDGVQLAKLYTENRQVVPMEQIPKDLQNATVAFEDKRFYTHSGIDLQGIVRALGRNLKSRDLTGQGGSTITQQLARNMGVEGLNSRKSFTRKLHEMLVAAQIEKSYTKQRILEMYLNQVYYGSGAYGVQAAAQTYFGKDVSKLDLAQCALLAGLPNQPTNVSPYRDKKAAEAQRGRVLDNMLEQHYITAPQYTQARAEYIHLAAPKPPKQGSQIFHAPYFVNYVVDQLKRRYGEDYLTRGNLKVYTTLNWAMQQVAENALVQGIIRTGGRGPTQGALVALDPKTGEIKAMVGGVDYAKDQFNIATQSRRQPGSSFKAVIYSAAIDSARRHRRHARLRCPRHLPDGRQRLDAQRRQRLLATAMSPCAKRWRSLSMSPPSKSSNCWARRRLCAMPASWAFSPRLTRCSRSRLARPASRPWKWLMCMPPSRRAAITLCRPPSRDWPIQTTRPLRTSRPP